MTAPERCELTGLLVEQCGCRSHRAGQTVEEQVDAERLALLKSSGWTAAAYPGVCARCGTPFSVGTPIAYEGHALGWRAACCSAVAQ